MRFPEFANGNFVHVGRLANKSKIFLKSLKARLQTIANVVLISNFAKEQIC